MAMILEYYGQHYSFPWEYRSQFARPFNRPITGSPYADQDFMSLDEAMRQDPALRQFNSQHRHESMSYSRPYEWYYHGIPRRSRQAFELLCEITGFQSFSRPAFGRWTADDVESRLRQYGPYAFFGFWNSFPHVILMVGIVTQGGNTNVVTIDPARGFPTSESLQQFNTRMASDEMQEFNFNGLNPLYLPQEQPIRDTVNHG
jgi:hypothetical protein